MPRHPIRLKERAFRLRKKGYSVKEIAKKLDISQSTSSLWIRYIKLNKIAQKRLEKRKLLPYYKSALRWHKKREEEERKYDQAAFDTITRINCDINHAKIYCSLLYWCEGGKNYKGSMRFVNSDPILLSTFLNLLRAAFFIDEKKLRVLMHLHEYHNEKIQRKFWSGLTKIPEEQFNRTFFKQHTKKRIRENYPGCVVVYYHDCRIAREIQAIYKAFSLQIKKGL